MSSDEAAGNAQDPEHLTFVRMLAGDTFDGQERVMSRAAWDLHCRATAHSARCGHPGFVPDEYLNGLSTETTITAAELCTIGTWERTQGGYRVLDWEAVEVCLDHVRQATGEEDPRALAWDQETEARAQAHPDQPQPPAVTGPVAELAAYFRRKTQVPEEDLARLTAAARAGGYRWAAIAASCGLTARPGTGSVAGQPAGIIGETGAELLFRTTQQAVEKLTGSRRYPPLCWPCPGCGQRITDRAATGRPVHVELGHRPGCPRLAGDQAAEDQRRRQQMPRLIAGSERAAGPVQRHWLAGRIIDDCPRCGWHGYFDESIATIGGDWAAAICDDCYADLHPDITVTVRFFAARWPRTGQPVAVIRQRTRSDQDFPDIGQMMTWQLSWQHTPMLVDEVRGNCIEDITEISVEEAGQIAAGLAARYWPPEAATLPWVTSVYPR